ncbi:hypothetical protein, partial [Nitrospira sp. BLG_2]|uniref:hypothetical protein n=1 Tax=Nitrospira sp. BLG_2 TaxID=3397507 RepID=UPI003B9A0CCC
RFKVYKRAHKACDTVNPVRSLRISRAVHLDLRCDGEAYGGCQAACLIFWKTDWLRPVSETGAASDQLPAATQANSTQEGAGAVCTEADVWKARYQIGPQSVDGPRYRCQATQLPFSGALLPWWDIRQYAEDYASGNVTIGRMLRGLVYATYFNLIQSGIGLGRPLRWLYDRFQSIWGGIPYPRKSGSIPVNQPTPTCALNLQPGELVRVRPYKDILATLNSDNKNRGLYFDAEAVPYCGGTYRVKARLNKFIDEKTGRLITLANSSIILEGVWCEARYSDCRMFCPRSIYSWWREIWLERVLGESKNTLVNQSDLRCSGSQGQKMTALPATAAASDFGPSSRQSAAAHANANGSIS